MIRRQDIAGVILAGGHSRRFGSNKAFACCRGRMLIDHALDLLAPACGEIIIATDRPEIFHETESRASIVRDVVPDKGPLGGIVTAMRSTAKQYFLILGCDIMAGADTIGALVRGGTGETRVASVDGRPQYLCGVYPREILPHFEECIERGILSMKAALKYVTGVNFTAVPPVSISNINTRKDLAEYERRMASHAL